MTTEIQSKTAALQKSIFEDRYYEPLYLETLNKCGMDVVGVGSGDFDDKQLINMANDFWMALPDGPQIRRGPFFALCEIAQCIFKRDGQ